jgi:hypothetical protein
MKKDDTQRSKSLHNAGMRIVRYIPQKYTGSALLQEIDFVESMLHFSYSMSSEDPKLNPGSTETNFPSNPSKFA